MQQAAGEQQRGSSADYWMLAHMKNRMAGEITKVLFFKAPSPLDSQVSQLEHTSFTLHALLSATTARAGLSAVRGCPAWWGVTGGFTCPRFT